MGTVMGAVDVSVILCTRDRPGLVTQAVAQYARQEFGGSRELVLVDSGVERVPLAAARYAAGNGRYLQVEPGLPLGLAMNAGCQLSAGRVLQKWDDDDQYEPGFLDMSVAALESSGRMASIWTEFLIATVDQVRRWANNGIMAGGTLAVKREAWLEVPWRGVASRIDAGMVEDLVARYGERALARVSGAAGAGMYTWVRHGGNMSRELAAGWGGGVVRVSLDAMLCRLPVWTGKGGGA